MDGILKRESHFFWVTLISIIAHLAFAFTASLLLQWRGVNLQLSPKSVEKQIEVTQIDRATLNKYRSVGIKGGSKEFQVPITPPKAIALPSPKPSIAIDPSALSMSLKPNQIKELGTAAKRTEAMEGFNYKKNAEVEKVRERQQNERTLNNMIKREMLQQSIASHEQGLVRHTDMNMHFEPPEGVEETELNSIEKKFYSFRKRSYEAYVNSFLMTYRQAVNQRPYLHQLFNSSSEHLTGKVTFDLEGNLVSIKILQSASNEIQKIFEKTLEGIKSLKNPPREFIERENEFSVYYSLKINNR